VSVLVPTSTEHTRRDRGVVASAVAATLLVIAGPMLAAAWNDGGPGVPIEEPPLPESAQRVLAELPDSFQAGAMVVVPAETDPFIVWPGGSVGPDRVDGQVVSLGVRGLTEYGRLPSATDTPGWLNGLGPTDHVYSDVGPLSFACVRWPGSARCTGALLAEQHGSHQIVLAGIGSPTSIEPVTRTMGFGSGGRRDVWLGWLPTGVAAVWVTVVGHQSIRDVPARTSEPAAVAGRAVWWVATPDAVSAVSFRDAQGNVVERITVGE
jgi:hypothetical protein